MRQEALVIDGTVYLIDGEDEVRIEASKVEKLWSAQCVLDELHRFMAQRDEPMADGQTWDEAVGAFARKLLTEDR